MFSPTLQVNVEYLQLDSRSFVTGEDRALALLFGAASDENIEARVAVKRIAQRLATLFATLKVPPFAAVACCRPWLVVTLAAPKDDRNLLMERLAKAETFVASAINELFPPETEVAKILGVWARGVAGARWPFDRSRRSCRLSPACASAPICQNSQPHCLERVRTRMYSLPPGVFPIC